MGRETLSILLGFLGSHGALCWGSEVGSVAFLGPLQYKLFPGVICMDLF